MKKQRFTEEQNIGALREHEVGTKAADLCPKHAISKETDAYLFVVLSDLEAASKRGG